MVVDPASGIRMKSVNADQAIWSDGLSKSNARSANDLCIAKSACSRRMAGSLSIKHGCRPSSGRITTHSTAREKARHEGDRPMLATAPPTVRTVRSPSIIARTPTSRLDWAQTSTSSARAVEPGGTVQLVCCWKIFRGRFPGCLDVCSPDCRFGYCSGTEKRYLPAMFKDSCLYAACHIHGLGALGESQVRN